MDLRNIYKEEVMFFRGEKRMWLEVETKVKISEDKLNWIRERIKGIGVFVKKEKKEDAYFAILKTTKSNYPKKAFRIRTTKDGFEINFKKWLTKHWTKNIVVKQEFEFQLKKIEQFESLLTLFRDLGFREWLKKIKESETYLYKKNKRARIEINKVKHLGYFIEIEYLCQEKNLPEARKVIEQILKELQIDPKQIDNTGYTKMLWCKKDLGKNSLDKKNGKICS